MNCVVIIDQHQYAITFADAEVCKHLSGEWEKGTVVDRLERDSVRHRECVMDEEGL
jgi:hypothetical protein